MMRNILLIVSGCLFLGCSSDSATKTENNPVSGMKASETKLVTEARTGFVGEPNKLTEEEKADGWELLFDGKNFDKWTEVGSDELPENGWAIENGAMVRAEGGNILTREEYSDFDLRFEFNLTPEANSGIKYFVTKLKNKENGAVVTNGPEYQIIDDFKNPDVKDQENEMEKSAAAYLLYAPENKNLLPAGQWNSGRIVADGRQVEHWLNGEKVLNYERGSEDFRKRREGTKFKNYEKYGEVQEGHILLTDHNDKVYFRNLKIKRL